MTGLRAFLSLRHPLAALAICTLLAQQLVGVVLTASPAMALESGFSLCLSGPPSADDDPLSVVEGAGFCPCTLHSYVAVLAAPPLLVQPAERASTGAPTLIQNWSVGAPATGPPPARAPPFLLS